MPAVTELVSTGARSCTNILWLHNPVLTITTLSSCLSQRTQSFPLTRSSHTHHSVCDTKLSPEDMQWAASWRGWQWDLHSPVPFSQRHRDSQSFHCLCSNQGRQNQEHIRQLTTKHRNQIGRRLAIQPIFISCGCFNKVSHIWCLKTIGNFSLIVLDAKSQKSTCVASSRTF